MRLTSSSSPDTDSSSIATAVMPVATRPGVSSNIDRCNCFIQRMTGDCRWGPVPAPVAGSTRSTPAWSALLKYTSSVPERVRWICSTPG